MKKQKITKKEWTTKKRSAAPKKDGGTVNTNGEWTPASVPSLWRRSSKRATGPLTSTRSPKR